MVGRGALHRADLNAALKVGAVERAAGHYWAMRATGAEADSVGAACASVAMDALRARGEAEARGEVDEAARLLAVAYAVNEDPRSLSRLLYDFQARLRPAEMRNLADMLVRASAPSSHPHAMGFFYRTLAEHQMAGASASSARSLANAQTVALLDMALHRDPSLDPLRMERVAKNTELFRYAAAIEDIRVAWAATPRSGYLCEICCFHLRHSKHPETRAAIDFLMNEPQPDPETLITRYAAMATLMAIDESVEVADQLAPVYPQYRIVRPLRRMADDLDVKPLACFGRAPSGRHLIYLSLVSWGARFIEMTAKTGLPSLLAPDNLPRLAADNDLVLEFVANLSDLERILAIPALQKLSEIAQIKIFGLPPEIEPLQNELPYVTFGFASHGTIRRAQRDGADLLFLLSDVVWSNGSFGRVAELVTRDKRAVFIDGLNARAAALLPALDAYRTDDGSSLSIDAGALWTLAAPALMPRTLDHLYDPRSKLSRTMPLRLIFRERESLTIHAFHKLPLYVSHAAFRKIRYFKYSTPDGAFAESVLDNIRRDQAIQLSRYDEILAVELSDEVGAVSGQEEIEITESVARYFRDRYLSERLYWNFEQGVRFPLKAAPGAAVVTEQEKHECLSRLRALFATHSVFVDWGRERDKIRRLEFGDEATHWRLTSTEEMKAC